MTANPFRRIAFLTPVLLALAACLDTGGIRPATGERWSESRVPRYGPASPSAALAPAPLRVGLLLPLTGPEAERGRGLLNAATLAVFENRAARELELLPRDTAGAPGRAGAAAVAALASGAAVLLGPVTPEAARYPVESAVAAATPILILTNDRAFAEPGVFAVGPAPEAAATRIVDYAYRQGVRRLAALAPASARGRAALRGLEGAALARRMELARAELIAPGAPTAAIRAAVADALRDMGPEGALFLPFPAAELGPFAAAIQAAGAPPPLLLGLQDWADASLPASPGFGRAIYAGADPSAATAFATRYRAAFGTPPVPGAALVYDMTAMLAAAGARASGRAFGAYDVTGGAGYVGVEGPFRLVRDGVVERNLAIVGVRDGRSAVIEPAPTRFGS